MTHIRSGSACAGKSAYVSRREAQHILRIQNRNRAGQVVVYKCQTCLLWHIGHKVNKQDTKRRKQ